MIRQAMTAWHDATKKMLSLTREVSEEKRDDTIAQIEAILDERDELQKEIFAPFTPEEEEFGKQLVELEEDVQKKLSLFMKRIRMDITEAQSKKEHIESYINPYNRVARDGTYYDAKQ